MFKIDEVFKPISNLFVSEQYFSQLGENFTIKEALGKGHILGTGKRSVKSALIHWCKKVLIV